MNSLSWENNKIDIVSIWILPEKTPMKNKTFISYLIMVFYVIFSKWKVNIQTIVYTVSFYETLLKFFENIFSILGHVRMGNG